MAAEERDSRLAALDVFVGEWVEQVHFPDAPPGRCTFAWDVRDTILVQRSFSPLPDFPDGMMVLAPAEDGYIQHYFDSRGVVRLYRMTLVDREWMLLRTEPDFSPLEFGQRYLGTISEDGERIDGQWETSTDGGQSWQVDFTLTYTRVATGSPR